MSAIWYGRVKKTSSVFRQSVLRVLADCGLRSALLLWHVLLLSQILRPLASVLSPVGV